MGDTSLARSLEVVPGTEWVYSWAFLNTGHTCALDICPSRGWVLQGGRVTGLVPVLRTSNGTWTLFNAKSVRDRTALWPRTDYRELGSSIGSKCYLSQDSTLLL